MGDLNYKGNKDMLFGSMPGIRVVLRVGRGSMDSGAGGLEGKVLQKVVHQNLPHMMPWTPVAGAWLLWSLSRGEPPLPLLP